MDFYFKYREYKRTLCSTFRHKGITLNVYRVTVPNETVTKYVLTKNREVILEAFSDFVIEEKFLDLIYMETGGSPELFDDPFEHLDLDSLPVKPLPSPELFNPQN